MVKQSDIGTNANIRSHMPLRESLSAIFWTAFFVYASIFPAKAASTRHASLTGTVYCGSTSIPARFATIDALSVNGPEVRVTPARTGADGKFSIHSLAPGTYFISVSYPGYVDALHSMPQRVLIHILRSGSIPPSLHRIVVTPHSAQDVTIAAVKGAVLSGNLSFSDEAPAVGLPLEAIKTDPLDCATEGCLETATHPFVAERTTSNDKGNFRLPGLAPGTYLIKTIIPLKKAVTWYFGDARTPDRATEIQLTAGEDYSGIAFALPSHLGPRPSNFSP